MIVLRFVLMSQEASGEVVLRSVKTVALALGFSDCRVASAQEVPHAVEFKDWLAGGHQGEMAWLERNVDRRCDPRLVVEGCQSVLCLSFDYGGIEELVSGISCYSQGCDYHKIIESKLMDLCDLLEIYGGRQRCYVDTGPVLEREFAELSGLGWRGKSGLIVRQSGGSRFFIGVILTTLALPADEPARNRCGRCSRCRQECPTQAIDENYTIDARRCVSYLTIENKGSIPVELRRAIGGRIYGCDSCQDACPWNALRAPKKSPNLLLRSSAKLKKYGLREFLAMGEEEFLSLFADSPIRRIKWRGFMRNVCVAVGNTGTKDDIVLLRRLIGRDEMVDEHAQWAIEEIETRSGGK